jgi:hypothetical protein
VSLTHRLNNAILSLTGSYIRLASIANAVPGARPHGELAEELTEETVRLAELWHRRIANIEPGERVSKRGPGFPNKMLREAILREVGVPALEVGYRHNIRERSVERIRTDNGLRGSDGLAPTPKPKRYLALPE